MIQQRTLLSWTLFLALMVTWGRIGDACGQGLPFSASGKPIDLSLRMEVARAIDRGNQWLMDHQSEAGHWSDADHPALTSFALVALQRDPVENHAGKKEPILAKGYDYLRSCAQPDGGIYCIEASQTYHTAVSMMAFLIHSHSDHEGILRRARVFVVREQQDFGELGVVDDSLDGGLGHGTAYPHSDLFHTMHALEALYFSKHLADGLEDSTDQLNWEAALHFVEHCQQISEPHAEDRSAQKSEDWGGFVDFPSQSEAGEHTEENGVTVKRAYGSMGYAGLLSYIYVGLDSSDERIKAVLEWLNQHFTLEQHAEMGARGRYFYYHTMTKALILARVHQMGADPSAKLDWRHALALKLLDLQEGDGSWKKGQDRSGEGDAVLSTSYAVLTLEMMYQGL